MAYRGIPLAPPLNIDRYYTSEINHSIKGLSRILTLTLILPD